MSLEARERLSDAWKKAGNPRWAGGRHVDKRGYTVVVLDDDHPFASMRDRRRRCYQHRLVMAEALGRPLSAEEEVHHLDLDRTHDALENLILVSGHEHKRIHAFIRHGADRIEAVERVLGGRA